MNNPAVDHIGWNMVNAKIGVMVRECSDKARYCLDFNRDNLVPYLSTRAEVSLYYALCAEFARLLKARAPIVK
jgi:hypothetical protein